MINKDQVLQPITERLKEYMSKHGLKAADIAEVSHVEPQKLSDLLRHKYYPSLYVVHKILLAFPDIRPSWLILGEGGMERGEKTTTEIEVEKLRKEVKYLREQVNFYHEKADFYEKKASN